MHIFLNIVISFFLIMALFWAVIPCAFGLHNFKKLHGSLLGAVGTAVWLLLIASHLLAFYMIWFVDGGIYWWLILPLCLHAFFLKIFGRDLGTS
jgi:hypothetical protein